MAKLPNDTTLHEFRALRLFALKRDDEAAAALYAVLSVGPGWDWTTLIGLYSDIDTYTTQLRTLEDYCRAHTDSASARFVLANHYLTQGKTGAAVAVHKQVISLEPGDALSAKLLRQLDPSRGAAAAGVPSGRVMAQQPLVMERQLISDRSGMAFNQDAGTFLEPSGWNVSGGVKWYPKYAYLVSFEIKVANPNGLEQVELLPAYYFIWSSDKIVPWVPGEYAAGRHVDAPGGRSQGSHTHHHAPAVARPRRPYHVVARDAGNRQGNLERDTVPWLPGSLGPSAGRICREW